MYNKTGEFLLFSYELSHSKLILRNYFLDENYKNYFDSLEFEAVEYFDIPKKFYGITITISDDDYKKDFFKEKGMNQNLFNDWRLFILSSNGYKYHVLSLIFKISEKVDMNQ